MLSPCEHFPFKFNHFASNSLRNCSVFANDVDFLKMNHLRCRRWEANNTESKGGKKRGKSPGFASLQDLFWYGIPVAWIFHMLLSDPLLKATELPKAHFLLRAYVAGQPLLNQSVSPEARIHNPKRYTCKVEAFGLLTKGAAQASQQSEPQYSGTKELCFHKEE